MSPAKSSCLSIVQSLVDVIFPLQCLLCREGLTSPLQARKGIFKADIQLCPGCLAKVRECRPPFCMKCPRTLTHSGEPFCLDCQKRTYFFDRAWSAVVYTDEMRRLLHLFKYARKTALRTYLSQLLVNQIVTYRVPVEQFDILLPVPLHISRRRERGFNQAVLIADILSRRFNIPLKTRVLIRCRATPNQARLTRKNRWTNIHGAFKIKQSQPIKQKNILLVDDLLTTGSTASEAARILKEAGAAGVSVLTVAVADLNK